MSRPAPTTYYKYFPNNLPAFSNALADLNIGALGDWRSPGFAVETQRFVQGVKVPVFRDADAKAQTIGNGFARYMSCMVDRVLQPPVYPGKRIYGPDHLAAVVAHKLGLLNGSNVPVELPPAPDVIGKMVGPTFDRAAYVRQPPPVARPPGPPRSTGTTRSILPKPLFTGAPVPVGTSSRPSRPTNLMLPPTSTTKGSKRKKPMSSDPAHPTDPSEYRNNVPSGSTTGATSASAHTAAHSTGQSTPRAADMQGGMVHPPGLPYTDSPVTPLAHGSRDPETLRQVHEAATAAARIMLGGIPSSGAGAAPGQRMLEPAPHIGPAREAAVVIRQPPEIRTASSSFSASRQSESPTSFPMTIGGISGGYDLDRYSLQSPARLHDATFGSSAPRISLPPLVSPSGSGPRLGVVSISAPDPRAAPGAGNPTSGGPPAVHAHPSHKYVDAGAQTEGAFISPELALQLWLNKDAIFIAPDLITEALQTVLTIRGIATAGSMDQAFLLFAEDGRAGNAPSPCIDQVIEHVRAKGRGHALHFSWLLRVLANKAFTSMDGYELCKR